ncbi:hypothetical protein [Neorhizobium alkalisoli]|uniref:Uncharacterized protein n=1 Tax=Neorhizobium alkalisoli TaxID=528178 RepID=A0A561R323_9HYPH|nr:hypothetical protein [Neorhizobium alkalisoli]TWF57028.1 hypothetical protein FHW37_102668 [Neorhizobium alkalisoli]
MNGNEEAKLLALMEAMFNGQKRTLNMVEAAIEKFSSTETEITKLNRGMNTLQELLLRQNGAAHTLLLNLQNDFSNLRNEISSRFDAIVARLEDIDRLLDERANDIKRAQIDLISQYNEVLNAVQDSSQAARMARDLDVRLTEVENKIARL